MEPISRAISIRQPLVELILQGKKRKEYRSQKIKFQGRVYLYASMIPNNEPSLWRKAGKRPGRLPTGKIVGTVEIVGCEPEMDSGFAYLLASPRRLRTHLKPKNHPQPCFWIPQF